MMFTVITNVLTGCILPSANVNPGSPEDTGLIADSDIIDEPSSEVDTEEPDTEDTEDTNDTNDSPDDSSINYEDGRLFMSGSHLVFKDGMFLANESVEVSPTHNINQFGLGTPSFPLLGATQDWGFGFKWAPDSPESAQHMFGDLSNNGLGKEMVLFQVSMDTPRASNYLTIQFYPEDLNNNPNTEPEYSVRIKYYSDFFSAGSQELCRNIEFTHNSDLDKRTYDRESLERGFRIFAMFEVHDESLDNDTFTLALETIRPSDDDWAEYTMDTDEVGTPYWTGPIFAVLSEKSLSETTIDDTECQSFENEDSAEIQSFFGKKVRLSNDQILESIKGRIDDLLIYQTQSPTFFTDSGSNKYDAVNHYFFARELGDLIPDDGGNDNLFFWNFDIQEPASIIEDESNLSFFETSLNLFNEGVPLHFDMLRSGSRPGNPQELTHNDATQYYDN